MTVEQKKQITDLAMRCVRDDKKEEMQTLLAEAEQAYHNGKFTKNYMQDLGMRMLAIIKLVKMAEFISTAKKIGKEISFDMPE